MNIEDLKEDLKTKGIDKIEIKDLGFSTMVSNCLFHSEIDTLLDLITNKALDVYRIRGLGKKGFSEIVGVLNALNLEFRSQGVDKDLWRHAIINRKNQNSVRLKDLIHDLPLDKINHYALPFRYPNKIMAMFAMEDINTVQDLLMKTEQEIAEIRGMDEKHLMDIVNTVKNFKFDLRPSDIKASDWLEVIRNNYTTAYGLKNNSENVDDITC